MDEKTMAELLSKLAFESVMAVAMIVMAMIFLKTSRRNAEELRSIGDSCHRHAAEQLRVYKENLDRMTSVYEAHMKTMADGLMRVEDRLTNLVVEVQKASASKAS